SSGRRSRRTGAARPAGSPPEGLVWRSAPRKPIWNPMDAIRLSPPRRLSLPVDNRWGAGDMSVLDFGDPKRPVDLVFVHANGFNAMTYRTLLAPLSGPLRIWAPDLRGHGLTPLPANPDGRRGWADHRD